jgi:hypothetical protein
MIQSKHGPSITQSQGRLPHYWLQANAARDLALALARKGIPVFPCREDKRPSGACDFRNATVDPSGIKRLWSACRGPLIGVPTGTASGIDVLDIDPRNGGYDWLRENDHRLPRTRTHQTQSGGRHLLFRHADGMRCNVGRVASGVDVRGDGGYVVWWPAAGLPVIDDASPACWPDWLLPLVCPPTGTEYRPRRRNGCVPNRAAIQRLLGLIVEAAEGERNSITFWVACRLGEMVATGFLDEGAIEQSIVDAAVQVGLPDREARATARSGLQTGRRG